MKRVLTLIGVLAAANLLGIAAAIAWLAATQRLTAERIEAVREILHEPAPVERARLEAEARAAEREAARQEASEEADPLASVELPDAPPLPADRLVAMRRELMRAEEFRTQRLERENAVLAQTTRQIFRQLDQERKAFEAEKAAFERRREAIADLQGDRQFQAALSVLNSVKPGEAKAMLSEIIQGRAGSLSVADDPGMTGLDRAVAYLDQLDEMIRGRVMAEFVKDSPTVAADLLERLRTFGLAAEPSGDPQP